MKKINQYVLFKQHLCDESKNNDINVVVNDLVGLHAQVPTTPYLSLLARTDNFYKEMLDEELYVKKSLIKIKCLRKTVFIIPKELIEPIIAATKKFFDISSNGYSKYFGISKEEFDTLSETIIETLQNKGLSTKEIKKKIESSVDISPIINHMCDQGLLVRGRPLSGWRSNIHNYHSFRSYLEDLDRQAYFEQDAKNLIVKLYIESFGPVTQNDIAWWTGFSKVEIREIVKSLGNHIEKIEWPEMEGTYIMAKLDKKRFESFEYYNKTIINLLPMLDPYVMGYKDRQRMINEKDYNCVYDFNGNATSTILLDGRIIGVWDASQHNKNIVKIHLFSNHLDDQSVNEIHKLAKKNGSFIMGKEVAIIICSKMTSLTERTAGGYQSPLRDAIET